MRTTLPALALLALLLLPTVAAAWSWNPGRTSLEVPPGVAGDQWRYRQTVVVDGDEGAWSGTQPIVAGESEILLETPGASRATDRYGVARDTVTSVLQQAVRGEVVLRETCHMLAAGNTAVRRDFDVAPPSFAWQGGGDLLVQDAALVGERYAKDWTPVSTFEGIPCPGVGFPLGSRIIEGDQVPFQWPLFAPGAPNGWRAPLSAPAEGTTFHGRDALRLSWDAADVFFWYENVEGEYSVTFADGLALPALVTFDVRFATRGMTRDIDAVTELVGLARGVGEPLSSLGSTTLPDRHPDATFVPFDPTVIDDSPFAFPYPLRDAHANLVADPQVGLAAFLDAHPEAVLVAALYERQMKPAPGGAAADTMDTDGGWLLHFADTTAAISVATVRTTGVVTTLGGAPLPMKTVTNSRGSDPDTRAPRILPAVSASMSDLAALVRLEGLRDLQSLEYFMVDDGTGRGRPVLFVAEVPYIMGVGGGEDDEGLFATLLPATGALSSLTTSRRATTTTGIVGRATSLEDDTGRGRSAFGALAGPAWGAGLAAGAVTVLGLLLLLIQFVVLPLFTRLRRATLLDHPVRARLHECVRADPGVHLADLVEIVGVGYGATRHHLDHLTKAGLLAELDIDGRKRYFVAGDVPPAAARDAAVLRSDTVRRVYELYRVQPDTSLREAARHLGLSAPTVHRAKKRLEAGGLLPAASAVEASLADA